MNWSDVLRCRLVHRYAKQIFKTYSESSFPNVSNYTSFSSLVYPGLINCCLKLKKTTRVVVAGFWCLNAPHESFLCLQAMIAQLRIGLESWAWCNENRLGIRILNMPMIFLVCLWKKWWCKMSVNTIFQRLVGGGGRCGTNWPTEVVE